MTSPARPRSPLAHGTGESCASCRDCPTCDGGRREPTAYRVLRPAPGVHVLQCTGCDGRTRACLNLRTDLAPEAAPCPS
jgi:hypothetical protein